MLLSGLRAQVRPTTAGQRHHRTYAAEKAALTCRAVLSGRLMVAVAPIREAQALSGSCYVKKRSTGPARDKPLPALFDHVETSRYMLSPSRLFLLFKIRNRRGLDSLSRFKNGEVASAAQWLPKHSRQSSTPQRQTLGPDVSIRRTYRFRESHRVYSCRPALFMVDAPPQHGVKTRVASLPSFGVRVAFRLDPAPGGGAQECLSRSGSDRLVDV